MRGEHLVNDPERIARTEAHALHIPEFTRAAPCAADATNEEAGGIEQADCTRGREVEWSGNQPGRRERGHPQAEVD